MVIKMKEKADAEAEAMASKVEKEGDIKAKDEAIKGEKTKIKEELKDLKDKEKKLNKQMEENVENKIKAEENAVNEEEDKIKKARDDKEEFQKIEDYRYFDWFDEGQWPDPEYDCTTDYDRWRKKWTRMKEHHCCRVAGKGCQDNFPTTIVFKNLLGVQVRVGFMEERLKGGSQAEIRNVYLPHGAPRPFYFYPNQEREFEVPYKVPIIFAEDIQGREIQRHPAPANGKVNIGNITQCETLWSKMSCYLPKWLLLFVPTDVRRYCKSWYPEDPEGVRLPRERSWLQKGARKEEEKRGKKEIEEAKEKQAELKNYEEVREEAKEEAREEGRKEALKEAREELKEKLEGKNEKEEARGEGKGEEARQEAREEGKGEEAREEARGEEA